MDRLKLENVSYSYRDTKFNVLDHVSCTFENGKVSCIVGSSGSGKKTLLSLIAGLDRPGSGEIYIDDTPLSGLDMDQYRQQKVSMIFQMFNLFSL